MNQQHPTSMPQGPDGSAAQPVGAVYSRLKAERIQEPLEAKELQAEVFRIPAWNLAPDGKWITRHYRFAGGKEAWSFCDFLFTLAEESAQPMKVTVEGGSVALSLTGNTPRRCGGGVTMDTLLFAGKLG